MHRTSLFAGLIVAVALWAAPAFGQANPGGGGRGNRQQFRQQMEERLKQELGVTDDEWKVLQPKVEKVQELQRATFAGRGAFFRRGRGGPDRSADPSQPPPSAVEQKADALQKVLDNKDAKPEEIKAALTAYRESRAQARADLTKAQDELRDLLTARQESVLVMAGMLE